MTTTPDEELDLGSKIREVLVAANLKAPALVAAGVVKNRQTVNGWIATGRISKTSLSKLAAYVDVPLDWWHIPKDVPRPSAKQMLEAAKGGAPAPVSDTSRMTRVVGDARLGVEGEFEEQPNDADGWVDYPARDGAYALRCKGDSMSPRIQPGEFVVVKPKKSVKVGDEVVVQTTKNKRMIKRLTLQRDGMVELSSVNRIDYPPITLYDDEIVHIHYVAAICKPDEYHPDM